MDYTKRTSIEDLYDLCKRLGLKNMYICRKNKLSSALKNPRYKNFIVNLDDVANGSHWVAVNKSKKLYFDSYAQPPPLAVPRDYKRSSTNKEIQSIDSSMCGGLSALWLYYTNFKSNEDYYKLFKDTYK